MVLHPEISSLAWLWLYDELSTFVLKHHQHQQHTWNLSRAPWAVPVEKNCHVEKFQMSIHDRCGEIWNLLHYQKIMGTIYDALLHFTLFCCKFFLLSFTIFCRKIVMSQFTRYCVEKIWAKNCVCGEKMKNIRYHNASTIAAILKMCDHCMWILDISEDRLIAYLMMNITTIIWATDQTFIFKHHQNQQ